LVFVSRFMNAAALLEKSLGSLTVPSMTERETAALMIAVASLLIFRVLRAHYLVAWACGWLAYGACLFLANTSGWPQSPAKAAFTHADFVLAMGLFAVTALLCAQNRRALAALIGAFCALLVCAAVAPLYLPNIAYLQLGLEAACRIIAAGAAVELLLSSPSPVIWSILFGVGIVTLNLHWAPLTDRISADVYLMAEVLLGASLPLLALHESRVWTRRLDALHDLALTIERGQSQTSMMQSALGKLKTATRAKAAWFDLMEGENLVPSQHVGLSPEILRGLKQAGMDETRARAIREGRAAVVNLAQVSSLIEQQLKPCGIRNVVVVPVRGKRSMIGLLSLGYAGRRPQNQAALDFLETAVQGLGIAAENLKFSEYASKSEQQWMNTVDSIQDLILAHDDEFRILKTNHAFLQRLEKLPADVLDQTCEAVMPRNHSWAGCPYCARGSGVTEGFDPCFGGQSVVSTCSYTEQWEQRTGMMHVVHDTSDRSQAEEKYRMLFEQAQEGVFVATPEGDLLDCNDAFVTMLGYSSRDELMALDMASVLATVGEERELFLREIEAQNYVRNFEVTARRKDGALLAVAESCFATRDPAGRIQRYQGFVLDITEKKRSEDEMRRRNRELNALNAMAVIATQSFDLDEILNLTLRQVISLFGAETGSVYLAVEPDGTYRRRAGWGPRSEARVRISEVTFPDGLGDLVMRSRAEVVTQDFLPHLPPAVVEFVCADRLPYWIWVLLWSKDKPIGLMGIVSKEDRHYSSNDENLLVAISRQLATAVEKVQLYEETCQAYDDLRRAQEKLAQSEKKIAERTEEGKAATVEAWVPASAKPLSSETAGAAPRESVLLGRVLLVEDEPTVLDLGRDVLVGAGAIVTTSTSIEDAKERMRKEPFNVIIMNGRMSAGGAQEMYDWTAATCSGLEKGFLFTFAGNVEEQTRAFLQEHGVPVLVKPFEVADLISQVRAVAHTKDQSALKSKEDKASATNAGA